MYYGITLHSLCNTSERETPRLTALVCVADAAGADASELALHLELSLRPNESLRARDGAVPTDTAAAAAAAAAVAGGCVPASSGHG